MRTSKLTALPGARNNRKHADSMPTKSKSTTPSAPAVDRAAPCSGRGPVGRFVRRLLVGRYDENHDIMEVAEAMNRISLVAAALSVIGALAAWFWLPSRNQMQPKTQGHQEEILPQQP